MTQDNDKQHERVNQTNTKDPYVRVIDIYSYQNIERMGNNITLHIFVVTLLNLSR